MAQVPYEHIEAPRVLTIDGVRAFNVGDPVPVATARAMGLLEGEDSPPILPAYGDLPVDFTDGVITVENPEAVVHPSAQDAPAPGDATTATATPPATTPAPTGATTTATPPQARTEPPKQGAR